MWKPLVGHKLPKTDTSHIRVTEEERLAQYVKVVDSLTIDQTKKLEKKVLQLEEQQAQEIQRLRQDFEDYKEAIRKQDRLDSEALDDSESRNKAILKKQYGIDDFEFEWVSRERAKELDAQLRKVSN